MCGRAAGQPLRSSAVLQLQPRHEGQQHGGQAIRGAAHQAPVERQHEAAQVAALQQSERQRQGVQQQVAIKAQLLQLAQVRTWRQRGQLRWVGQRDRE